MVAVLFATTAFGAEKPSRRCQQFAEHLFDLVWEELQDNPPPHVKRRIAHPDPVQGATKRAHFLAEKKEFIDEQLRTCARESRRFVRCVMAAKATHQADACGIE